MLFYCLLISAVIEKAHIDVSLYRMSCFTSFNLFFFFFNKLTNMSKCGSLGIFPGIFLRFKDAYVSAFLVKFGSFQPLILNNASFPCYSPEIVTTCILILVIVLCRSMWLCSFPFSLLSFFNIVSFVWIYLQIH